jgi:hypothetical protein
VPPDEPVAPAAATDALAAWARGIALGWRSFAALSDPRPFRDMWLAHLRQVTADTLRSPPFLALMKFNLSLLARRAEPPSSSP